jgi:hypothetical protein
VDLLLPGGGLGLEGWLAPSASTVVERGGHRGIADPSPAEVDQALDALRDGHVEYVILEVSDDHFLQAAGDGDGPYVLQRCAGDAGAMASAPGGADADTVRRAMHAYLAGDASAGLAWDQPTVPGTPKKRGWFRRG